MGAKHPGKICWITHQLAIQRMNSTDNTQMLNFIHRCLPMNRKLHNIDTEYLERCLACNCIKTHKHGTTCNNNQSDKLRKKIWKNLAKKQVGKKLHTPHYQGMYPNRTEKDNGWQYDNSTQPQPIVYTHWIKTNGN